MRFFFEPRSNAVIGASGVGVKLVPRSAEYDVWR